MTTQVLVTSAGTASAISVIKALRAGDRHDVHILAVDADPTAPGLYLADEHALIPRCSEDTYIPALLDLCERHDITAAFPIYSREIEVVAAHEECFSEIDVALLVSPPHVVQLCNDKRRMGRMATDLHIPSPHILDPDLIDSFPVFVKPNGASGSEGARCVENERDLTYERARGHAVLFQEYVAGQEYTVDMLWDREGNLVVASPRSRLATRSGQSVKGRTVDAPELIALSSQLGAAAGIIGPCNAQFIQRDGEYVFIELNPRYAAGGLMLTVAAGANIPLLALKLMLGQPIEPPHVHTGVTMLRYWEEVILTGDEQA